MLILKLKKIKFIFFYIFVFTLPFEYWNPFGIASYLSVAKIAGFSYAFVSILNLKQSIDLKYFKVTKILLIIWLFSVLLNIFNYYTTNTIDIFQLTFLQNIFLYWLLISDFNNRFFQVKYVILIYILSSILMCLLLNIGIGLGNDFELGVTRITFFGNNSNTSGNIIALSILFCFFIIFNRSITFKRKSFLFILPIPFLFDLLLLTGSRGALVVTLISVFLLIFFNKTSNFKRFINYFIIIICSFVIVDKIMESEMVYKRLIESSQSGDTSGRVEIWSVIFDIWIESPLFGLGFTGAENKLVYVFGRYLSAHNLFLDILISTGIVGLILFLFFLYYHLKESIVCFKKGNVIKFILFVFYITTVIKSGGALNDKLMWLVLAIILGGHFENLKIRTYENTSLY